MDTTRLIHAQEIWNGRRLSSQTVAGGPQSVMSFTHNHEDRTTTFKTVDELGETRTWTVPTHEIIGFPRRPNGETYDWRKSEVLPTVDQLAFGDLLPPANFESNEPQQVISVERTKPIGRPFHCEPPEGTDYPINGLHGDEVTLMTKTTNAGLELPPSMRRYVVPASVGLTFPRPANSRRYARPRAQRKSVKYKTEPVVYRHRDSGALFSFMAHPSGRGRWPKSIPVYNPGLQLRHNGRPHHCRPPRFPDHLLEEVKSPTPPEPPRP